MVNQKSGLGVLRLLLRLTSIILITWPLTFLISLAIGTIIFGHVPSYGIDADPHSLDSTLLNTIQLVSVACLTCSIAALPALMFILIYMVAKKASFTWLDRLLPAGALLAVLIFIFFKYFGTRQFEWHFD